MECCNGNVANILHEKECPFQYKCLSTDCIECAKLHMEKGSEESVSGDT